MPVITLTSQLQHCTVPLAADFQLFSFWWQHQNKYYHFWKKNKHQIQDNVDRMLTFNIQWTSNSFFTIHTLPAKKLFYGFYNQVLFLFLDKNFTKVLNLNKEKIYVLVSLTLNVYMYITSINMH